MYTLGFLRKSSWHELDLPAAQGYIQSKPYPINLIVPKL